MGRCVGRIIYGACRGAVISQRQLESVGAAVSWGSDQGNNGDMIGHVSGIISWGEVQE